MALSRMPGEPVNCALSVTLLVPLRVQLWQGVGVPAAGGEGEALLDPATAKVREGAGLLLPRSCVRDRVGEGVCEGEPLPVDVAVDVGVGRRGVAEVLGESASATEAVLQGVGEGVAWMLLEAEREAEAQGEAERDAEGEPLPLGVPLGAAVPVARVGVGLPCGEAEGLGEMEGEPLPALGLGLAEGDPVAPAGEKEEDTLGLVEGEGLGVMLTESEALGEALLEREMLGDGVEDLLLAAFKEGDVVVLMDTLGVPFAEAEKSPGVAVGQALTLGEEELEREREGEPVGLAVPKKGVPVPVVQRVGVVEGVPPPPPLPLGGCVPDMHCVVLLL